MCSYRGKQQLPWGAFELWMYHIRGGSGVQVTKGKAKPDFERDDYVHAIGAVASRDGKYLYYTKRNKLFNAYNNLDFPLSQVVAARPGDRRRRHDHRRPRQRISAGNFTRWNEAGLWHAALTTRPDCGSATWPAARSAGSSFPFSTTSKSLRYTRDLIPGYAFTPDGKSVLAAYGGKIHRLDVQTGTDTSDPVSRPAYRSRWARGSTSRCGWTMAR